MHACWRWTAIIAVVALVSIPGAAVSQSAAAAGGPADVVQDGVNWTTGFVFATGRGAASESDMKRGPQYARARAIEAATAKGRAELLAIVKGVRIDAEKTVSDQMVASDIVRERVEGFIRGARAVETKDLGDGVVEVVVAIRATGDLAQFVLPSTSPAPRPAVPPAAPPQAVQTPPPAAVAPVSRPAPAVFSGLVVDARGLGVKPAMAPKILSEAGQEVYGFSVVDRAWVIQQGMVGYSKDVVAAQAHERVTDRPLTVKAIAASGANKTDVVISNVDAKLLLGSVGNLSFLEKARVVVVVD